MKQFSLFLVLCLSLLHGIVAVSEQANVAYNTAQGIVRNHLGTSLRDTDLCSSNNCCNVTATENCSMDKLQRDETTFVFPGGNTRCITSYSTPYAFQVIPGDSDKLLFFFEGGGVCWNKASTEADGVCTHDIYLQPLVGVFDRVNPKNRFRDYTIVHILYCSGDFHSGNVVRPYNDKAGQPITQVGLNNVRSAINWVNDQIKLGFLSDTFTDLAIMGCSAGAIASQIWSNQLMKEFKWKKAGIVPDSCVGVFPADAFAQIMYDVNFCASGFLSPELAMKCYNKMLTLKDLNLESMANHPDVSFSFIESKVDDVQWSFYTLLALTYDPHALVMTPSDFYNRTTELFSEYNAARKNFVTYLIDGPQHCYTTYDLHFTADPQGAKDNGDKSNAIMLSDWLNKVPLSGGESISSQCEGNKFHLGVTYCSNEVVPKTYTKPSV